MFKQKIFESLKTKYKDLGFSKEALEGVATQLSAFITEEDKIETAVAGSETLLKSLQSHIDSRVNAYKSESEKYKAEIEQLKKKSAQGSDEKSKTDEDVPEWAKTLLESHKKMGETLSTLQKEKTNTSLKELFVQKMNEKKVPESFFRASILGREFSEISQVEELVNSVSNSYENFKQDATNVGFSYTQPPESGTDPKKEEDAFVESIRQETKKIVEQNQN